MVDAAEWEWVRKEVLEPDEPYDHLILASTLPFLLLPGVHHLEGWDESISRARGAGPASGSARSCARPSTSSTGRRGASRSPR